MLAEAVEFCVRKNTVKCGVGGRRLCTLQHRGATGGVFPFSCILVRVDVT